MRRTLLTPDEYEQIVRDGRAAEVLAIYVAKPGGRPSVTEQERKAKRAAYARMWRRRRGMVKGEVGS